MNLAEIAERLLREYGAAAEGECDARVSYHDMQGDKVAAEQWRRIRQAVESLRRS